MNVTLSHQRTLLPMTGQNRGSDYWETWFNNYNRLVAQLKEKPLQK